MQWCMLVLVDNTRQIDTIYLLSLVLVFYRPKHPTKVHVWAGISMHCKTEICAFDGTMNSLLYIEILERTLIPFLQKVYPSGYHFMQDNDPKHTSKAEKQYFFDRSINWWPTPAESTDLNPRRKSLS